MKYLEGTMIGKSYFLFSLLQVGLSQDSKANTPEEVTAEKGSCVQIPCNYSYPMYLANRPRVGIWHYDKSGTVTTAFHSKDHNIISPQFQHRTRLSGDLNDDNCSLIINNVRWQDVGRYYFRIEFDDGNKFNYKPGTRLQVSAQEWQGETQQLVTAQEGSCVQIPCHYSYPSCLGNQSRCGVWFNAESETSEIAFHSKDHKHVLPRLRHRTRLSGDLKDGDCSLIIINIRREDAGPYYFRIEFEDGPNHSYHPFTRLQVSAEPSQEWKGETQQLVTAQEGSCVQIPCHYSYPSCLGNQSRVGVWFNEESGRSQLAFHSKDHKHELPRFHHRTRLSGDLKDGECSLIINNITREDAGPYYFRIEFDDGPSHSYHPVTRLQVSAEPSQEWKGEIQQLVTAQEGSCVQIPCHYSYPSCLGNQSRGGVWFNAESGTTEIAFHSKDHNHELPRLRHRTRLSGDLKDGECSLIINNITREDAGPYYFRIEFDGGPSHSYHPVTRLNVSDFTDKPTIFPVEIIEGKSVDISCTFNTTCNGTAPVLTWDTLTDVPGSVSNTVTQHGVTLTYTSVLSLTPSLRHHGQNLTCRLRYPSVSSERTLVLNVTYKPEMSQKSECTRKAEEITCICVANSNPPGVLTWHLPDANISDNQTHGHLVSHLVRDGHLVIGSLILTGPHNEEEVTASCSVRNPHGEAMFKVYLWAKDRNSNKWTIGLLTAGIILSVFVIGILIFFYVTKIKTLNKERVSETNVISLSSPPVSVEHQANQNIPLTEPQNTTGDTTREGKAPAPQDPSEGAMGGDTECGSAEKPDDLLYASINFSKPSQW
ncbi:sialic acid-binding Ig-like lectin 12 isoform X1 [Scyliorhinus canicula]|uniref:sialic acid-binding Ig-like lectin 12 isoform X1 n=1 Tax=Scyliorhinus canicula TaxID=7830 RepID=UPI0018F2ECF7|nr:sialic acid-binding Ig-like lectin 12 isoform X1 [Scyliorhinus canicula]XP_038670869.1 sialic acid-binding Ig-like lectin 12 isoform X1 [Scyliorhinus canicula]XP_038670870.1 sialic acid-binding Ig-like lectin 12 isoform X1 [Scyliorhinus canicula]